jgi:hypothetical protein
MTFMTHKQFFIMAIAVIITATGCNKETFHTEPLSSITIANLVLNGTAAKLNGNTVPAQNININAGANFSLPVGDSRLYIWPLGDSLNPYYNKIITSGSQEIYTLFLAGPVGAVEPVLIKENLPAHTDSSFGIRFINLSPGSPAIKFTRSTTPTVAETGNLNYKDIADFKTYPALSVNSTYTFQARNATTDALIASITLAGASIATGLPRFNNITLALRGVVGGTPAPGISRINNF